MYVGVQRVINFYLFLDSQGNPPRNLFVSRQAHTPFLCILEDLETQCDASFKLVSATLHVAYTVLNVKQEESSAHLQHVCQLQ